MIFVYGEPVDAAFLFVREIFLKLRCVCLFGVVFFFGVERGVGVVNLPRRNDPPAIEPYNSRFCFSCHYLTPALPFRYVCVRIRCEMRIFVSISKIVAGLLWYSQGEAVECAGGGVGAHAEVFSYCMLEASGLTRAGMPWGTFARGSFKAFLVQSVHRAWKLQRGRVTNRESSVPVEWCRCCGSLRDGPLFVFPGYLRVVVLHEQSKLPAGSFVS